MLFGLKRVGPGLHFFATLMVAAGTLMSAFWILSANSWMQTPAGYGINEAGQFVPIDWLAAIFNPSFPYRFVHMVLAAYLTTALVVGGVGAWHLLRNPQDRPARLMFSMAMWMALLVAPLQVVAGDLHGLNTFEHQPAKIAAMEGHWEARQAGAPLILFGVPDDEAEETRYRIELPNMGSLILTHEWNGVVQGLKAWPKEERPPSEIVFWSFRLMVALGFAMAGLGLWSLVARLRGTLYDGRVLLWCSVLMAPSGFGAVLAGWITTEVGRQPWTVYNVLTTAESVSPPAGFVLWGFRLVGGFGFAMAGLGLWSLVARLRGTLYDGRVLLLCSVLMAPSGFGAVLAGWITTEVGRQPWTVYNVLTTAESVSPLAAPAVAASLLAFVVVYFAVFGAGPFYVLRLMGSPPAKEPDDPIGPLRAAGITPAQAIEPPHHQQAE